MIKFSDSVKNLLRPVKRAIERFFPRNWRISPPITQLYLGGSFESRYSLVNFPSLFSPKTAQSCLYEIALYDRNGFCVEEKKIQIEPFGSLEIVPSKIFSKKLPDLGIFTARISSVSPFFFLDRHLGKITSHIYAFFLDKTSESFALVHPQTTTSNQLIEQAFWKSAVLWDSESIKKITAFQINPTTHSIRTTLFLINQNGSPVKNFGEVSDVIPPMGSRMVSWNLEASGLSNTKFTIGALGLSTHNAKPIVFTYFEDGTFTGMHS